MTAWKNDQVSEVETSKIIELAREALKLEGDFVELGCYKGDTSLLLAEVVKNTPHRLWLYDSFEGLPEKTNSDFSEIGKDFQKGELLVTKREVKERFLRAGFKVPVIKKAWFSELTSEDLPSKIAFAFLDGDFYESIRDSLKLVEDKMVPGGVVIVHDYTNEALPGVAKAVDEWMRGRNLTLKKQGSLVIIEVK
ncbi:class I SAM-dependent methyltransferase [Candidatus Saccharibacteria bacterium]|nr:class I SAM-dependent methyltransferase [Candidatus Saccharibacteria bacterium]